MYTIVLVNVKRFRAFCGFYAIENKLLLLLFIKERHFKYCWAIKKKHYHAEILTPVRIVGYVK